MAATLSRRLNGRVAIVTGASSGIGRAIALIYAREGAKIVCADRHPTTQTSLESNVSTNDLINRQIGESIFHETDVCSASSVDDLTARAVLEFGRVDVIVNAAGVAPEIQNPNPIWSVSDTVWTQTMGVNITGILNCCRSTTRQMLLQEPLPNGDRGWVINLSSIYGQTAVPGNVAYCASKHAVLGLTKSAALDCAPFNIRVNAICPGFTRSAMTSSLLAKNTDQEKRVRREQPLKGIGSPEDVAKVALTLASDDASWITGTAIAVDGGALCQ